MRETSSDLNVEFVGHAATICICRPPNNYLDAKIVAELADLYEDLDRDPECRAIVLSSEGKHFCAGAQLGESTRDGSGNERAADLYRNALRLFRTSKPVVAAVQGAAVGGGLGLALSADFRVTCEEARFWANFARLGFHHGFGLTITLPRLVGAARAELLLLAARRVSGGEAVAMGLADRLVPQADVQSAAAELASELASSAPLAVQSIRSTMRDGLADAVAASLERELAEQTRLRKSNDFLEGLQAMKERRPASFQGE